MAQAREHIALGFQYTGDIISFDPAINVGTLALIEPAHPAMPVAGVPTGSIPNLAAETANALRGGAGADWAVTAADPNGVWNLSRTTKGGIKGAVNTGPSRSNNPSWSVTAPGQLNSYVDANRGHMIYVSLIYKPTVARSIGAGGDWLAALFPTSGDGRLSIQYGSTGGGADIQAYTAPGATVGGSAGTSAPKLGQPVLLSVASTVPTAVATIVRALGFRTSNAAFTPQAGVHYRAIFEDLTVSGLSYSQAHARDQATMTKLFAAGGRYNGDA